MKKITLTCAYALLIGTATFAQDNWSGVVHDVVLEPCGTDAIELKSRKDHPAILTYNQELEKFTQDFIKSNYTNKSGASYIIPVVYHILNQGGTENIHDSMIGWDLKIINKMFSKKDPQVGDVIPEFEQIVADMQIEFRLAKTDPDGNPTTGIERITSSLTENAGESSKLNQWPPSKYLNIWTVNTMANGSAANTIFPGNAALDSTGDGILIKAMYVGTTRTMGHEIGHYLNVSHTWGIMTQPGDPAGCDYDDLIDDTPNTIGWTTCNLAGTSCGTLNNVQNYMDYSGCTRMFTEGQKARIHACLNSTTANRNKLWSLPNLIATGVAQAGDGINEIGIVKNIEIFPNPANESSTLSFTLDSKSNVSISVVDMLGKEVANIRNGKMEKGTYNFNIGNSIMNAGKGIFILKLTANDGIYTQKLVVN